MVFTYDMCLFRCVIQQGPRDNCYIVHMLQVFSWKVTKTCDLPLTYVGNTKIICLCHTVFFVSGVKNYCRTI